MKQALILANELAIERYRKKMLRPGYPQTIHDLQHHPFNAAEHLDLFIAEIQASRNDLEAFNIFYQYCFPSLSTLLTSIRCYSYYLIFYINNNNC